MLRPSGENAAEMTRSEWPSRGVPVQRPSAPSRQTLAVLSKDAVTMLRPSGENAAEVTMSEWPSRGVPVQRPSAPSRQTLAVLS